MFAAVRTRLKAEPTVNKYGTIGCGSADRMHRRRHRPGCPERVKYPHEFILQDVSVGVVQWTHSSVINMLWSSERAMVLLSCVRGRCTVDTQFCYEYAVELGTGDGFIVLCPVKNSVCRCSPVTSFSWSHGTLTL